jgi:TPR repeat protein
MKLLAILTALMLLASPVTAADFQKGLAADERGDHATALKEFRPLAELGHPGAQYKLGAMYGAGKGVPRDYATAVKWLRKAAERG